jgi:hypothetical protein
VQPANQQSRCNAWPSFLSRRLRRLVPQRTILHITRACSVKPCSHVSFMEGRLQLPAQTNALCFSTTLQAALLASRRPLETRLDAWNAWQMHSEPSDLDILSAPSGVTRSLIETKRPGTHMRIPTESGVTIF